MKRTIDIMAAETQVESWRAEVRELRKTSSTVTKGLSISDAALMASVYELCADQLTALIKKAMESR